MHFVRERLFCGTKQFSEYHNESTFGEVCIWESGSESVTEKS